MTQSEFKPIARWDASVFDYFEKAFGAEHLQKLSQTLSRPPLNISFRLNRQTNLQVRRATLCHKASGLY